MEDLETGSTSATTSTDSNKENTATENDKQNDEEKDINDDDDDDDNISNPPVFGLLGNNLSIIFRLLLLVAVIGYSTWAYIADWERARPLLILELLVLAYIAVGFIAKKFFSKQVGQLEEYAIAFFERMETDWMPIIVSLIFVVVVSAFLIEERRNIISGFGLIVFVLFSYIISWKPTKVNCRPIIGGFLLQFILALIILRTPAGFQAFDFLGDQVQVLLQYTYSGSSFVYGFLVDTDLYSTPFQLADGGSYYLSPPLYFDVLSTVFFFAPLISVCHYLGIVEFLVTKIGYILAMVMGTSAAETLNSTANIFIGGIEAPLMIKSFLPKMTDSELHSIMTSGMATIAGSVLAAYIKFESPQHTYSLLL